MSVDFNTESKTQLPYRDYNRGSNNLGVASHAQNQNSKFLKPASFLGATTGVCLSLAHIAKKQNVKLLEKSGFKEFFKPKNWNFSKLEYKEKDAFLIAGSSTLGGLSAGLALDGENKKAKLREGLQQMIGNLIIPIGFVTLTEHIFKSDKTLKAPSKTKNILKVGRSIAALAVGMAVGNVVANKLNEKLLGAKEERKFKMGDLAGQVDDVCLALLLVSPENKLLQKIGQFIPLALILPGYETGIKKSKYD